MVLLPIFKELESESALLRDTRKQGKKEEGEKVYASLKENYNAYIEMIESAEQYSLGVKVSILLQFYSIFDGNTGMKALSL